MVVLFLSAVTLAAPRPGEASLMLEVDPASRALSGEATYGFDAPVTMMELAAAKVVEVTHARLHTPDGAFVDALVSRHGDHLTVSGPSFDEVVLPFRSTAEKDDPNLLRFPAYSPRFFLATTPRGAAPTLFPQPADDTVAPTWRLRVTAPKGHLVSAPATIDHTEAVGDRTATIFHRSVALPAWALALAVGPFEVVPGPVSLGVPIRALRTGVQDPAPAFKTLAVSLPKLVEAAGPYPFPGLDLLFGDLPLDVAHAGAPGLIAQPDHAPPEQSTGSSALSLALARQWFGGRTFPRTPRDAWLVDGAAWWLTSRARSDVIAPTLLRSRGLFTGVRPRPRLRDVREDGWDTVDSEHVGPAGGALLQTVERWWAEQPGVPAFATVILGLLQDPPAVDADAWLAARDARAPVPTRRVLNDLLDLDARPEVRARCTDGALLLSMSTRAEGLDTHGDVAVPVWVEGDGIRHVVLLDRAGARIVGPCPKVLVLDAVDVGYYRARYTQAQWLALTQAPSVFSAHEATFRADVVEDARGVPDAVLDALRLAIIDVQRPIVRHLWR